MSADSTAAPARFKTFRLRLAAAMMLVVATLTVAGLAVAQRHSVNEAERELQRDFRVALEAANAARETRAAALQQRCLVLVQKARIHAALEDDALDLLYPNARDELLDLMAAGNRRGTTALHAKFWRFLDQRGGLIPVVNASDLGALTEAEAAQLALKQSPVAPQVGYLPRASGNGSDEIMDQIITTPIFSTATGRPIAALAVGFDSGVNLPALGETGVRLGIWADGRLQLPGYGGKARDDLRRELTRLVGNPAQQGLPVPVALAGTAYLLLFQPLNADSLYPTAYEVCLYPLAATQERQRQLRWQILGLGSLFCLAGLAASHLAATRLAKPVEKLAADSAQNIVRRDQAETALELTQAELQRAARFSSDASHQLKTPIAVFRAGLEELLSRPDLPEPAREELMTLVNQTYRLTSMIEDLLLLSRLDEGRQKIAFGAVDLGHLVAGWLDDLSVLPQGLDLTITIDVPATVLVAGERRYVSLILQNLLENARKYNRPGGRLHVSARSEGERVILTVGNTGTPIPPNIQPHIFNRFHRGAAAEDIPGHGLGLNLARLLARLHGGDVRLLTSADDWTEFAVTFRLAKDGQISVPSAL